jgi:beta-xylosidase
MWSLQAILPVIAGLSATASAAAVKGPSFYRNAARQTDALENYLFAYFTNDTLAGEKIYFAASNGNDALDWTELNNGQPVLTSTMGTGGVRDPFIIRSNDGSTFYLIATDLSIGSGTSWDSAVRQGSRYIEIWESNDLETWSEQRHVLVSPETAGNTWAPEAYYDSDLGAYIVFWASELFDESDTEHTGSSYHRVLYATTTDFVTFGDPVIWEDTGVSRIDSTVIDVDGVYYRFTKDEGGSATGCVDIIQESSTDLLATNWTTVTSCIGANAGTAAVEGPTIFKSNPDDVNGEKYYLFVDEYSGRHYLPLETDDIANPNWQLSSSYSLPTSPRHGTVLPITATEWTTVTAGTALKARSALVKRDSPVLPGYNADPNIAVYGSTYYIYPTTDGLSDWGAKDFYVWSSPDLVSWTRSDSPILTLNGDAGNVPWATGNAWAPTIAEKDGKYYFYFCGHNPTYDAQNIGVAVADSPTGPFTAESGPLITNTESITSSQAIDPDAFLDPVSGKYYLFWGNGKCLYAELGDDMVSIKEDTIGEITGLTNYMEGTFVNYRDGLYHLTYSINDTRSPDYKVGYASATSVTGPYTYQGVVLQKDESQGILGTGHNSIIQVPGTDDWYMAYHRFAIPNGNGTEREVTIDRVTFNADTGLMNEVTPTLSSVDAETVASS